MVIRFNESAELEVITDCVDDMVDSYLEIFEAGEIFGVDIFDEKEASIGVQFGNGSVVWIDRELVEILQESEV